MTNWKIKTLIVSDIKIEGHLVEIYLNGIEIGYLEQKSPEKRADVTLLDEAAKIPTPILNEAIREAQKHLYSNDRNGLKQGTFNDKTSIEEYNLEGEKLVKRILYDPHQLISTKHYHHAHQNVKDIFENNGQGCGLRFSEGKEPDFIGFLDKREKNVGLDNDRTTKTP